MRQPVFVILACALLAPPVRGEEKKSPELDEKAIAALVQKAMKEFEAPGVAVVIVQGDKVVYLKGHGVQKLGGDSPVTPDTLFAIASCTKAFTATAIGLLIQDGKMSWDDPVRKHLPGFRLNDPLADREVTIRDLLCHRTGVVRHDILWVVHPWQREEMIRRSQFLRSDKSFRSEWGYNNLQYAAAGEASARAAGMPWEELVRSRLLNPLGMKATNFRVSDMEKSPNYARPHARKERTKGPIQVIAPLPVDALAAAGGINSSVRDLSAWLRFQLAEGRWEGKPLLKAEILRQTHAPLAVVPISKEMRKVVQGVTVQQSYALGWQVADYRGRETITHGGSLDGYRSRVVLLPEEKIGIAILSNLDSTSLPEALSNSLLDLQLQAPAWDWNAKFLEMRAELEVEKKKKEERLLKERKPDTKPALPLGKYAGTYGEPAHGQMRITAEGGVLTVRWGKFTLPAEHWHFDTFRLKEPPVLYLEAFGDRLVQFRLDRTGEVEGFSYLGHEFRKSKPTKK